MLHPLFPLSFPLLLWLSICWGSLILLFVASSTGCFPEFLIPSKDSGIRLGSAHHCSSFAYSELLCSPPFLTLVSCDSASSDCFLLSAYSAELNRSPSEFVRFLYFFKFLLNLDSKFYSNENSLSFL